MTILLCNACGTSCPDGADPPAECRICTDNRQYVPATGQSWTTREALARQHRNAWKQHQEGMLSLQSQPHFAIGQRAFLLQTPAGNILWDCITLLDKATEALVRALGGGAAPRFLL